MARISLVEAEKDPEFSEFVEKLKAGRRGKLLNIYKLLLHNPPAARGWFDYLNMVRWDLGLEGRLREMVIIRIAYLNHVQYVINQHVPELAEVEGLSISQCDALKDWKKSDLFNKKDRSVLNYTDAMTKDIYVSDAVYEQMSVHFEEKEIIALTVLIGTYNMHTRIFRALNIDLEK